VSKNNSLYDLKFIWKRTFVYSCGLFIVAVLSLLYAYFNLSSYISDYDWSIYLFFFVFGLFTIFMGYPHPNFGYASFDRVAQISSILVLGPIPAAMINGLASLVFPLINIYFSESKKSKKSIAISSIHNSAMMTLMILISGLLFEYLGGTLPLTELSSIQLLWLIMLLVIMQVLNSLGMRTLILIRKQKIKGYFSRFATLIELGSGLAAIFFAIVFIDMNLLTVLLFIFIMISVIFVLNQFALMRNQLESSVKQRTQDLQNKTEQLEYMAMYDELTGLVNRRYVNKHIEKLLNRQDIDNKGIFIAFADIDDFKKINDNYSHDIGDEVLLKIGKVLQQFCTEKLIIARFGGEEFLFCFAETDSDSVIDTCENISKQVNGINVGHISDKLDITFSIGIANAHKNSLHKTLISRADTNLYKAKENGKNQIIY
jgi:diguanylate cyclase (GGDEF)-like protein